MFLVYFLTFGLFVVLFTREVIAPASGATCDKRWRIFAGIINTMSLGAVVVAGVLFSTWIDQNSLITLPGEIGTLGSSLIVFLTASFMAYLWHRLTHISDTLWRIIHQLHHSPARIETLTAFYAHPVDSFAASLLNAVVAYLIFGVSAPTAGLALMYVSIFGLIAHADMKTPYWLGYFIQRPEMHRIHHERDSHKNNYGLPLWDMLFGTWRNPKQGKTICGFSEDNQYKIREMLLMQSLDE